MIGLNTFVSQQESDRKLITHFYKPTCLNYRYFTLEASVFSKEKFIQEINSLFKSIISSSVEEEYKPIYESLKTKIVNSCNFTSTTDFGRYEEFQALVGAWMDEFFNANGINTLAKSFICDPSCFEGLSPPITSKPMIVCSDFAFLQLGEENANSTFFSDMPSNALFKNVLADWGYHLVDLPEPGDLVVYFDKDGVAEHFGIWNNNGKVVSKWGWKGSVYEHPIHLVPSSYDDSVVFYRKPLYQEILQELDQHSGGAVEDLHLYFQQLIKRKLLCCHKDSFADYFYREWGDQCSRALTNLGADEKIEQMLEKIEKIAKNISFDIKLSTLK